MMENPAPFIIHAPAAGSPVSPAVFDNPHSGKILPPGFIFTGTDRQRALLRDSHIEILLSGVPAQGVPVLENPIDRVYIDPNREEDEIDPSALNGTWTLPSRITWNIRALGLGLIPTALRNDEGHLVPLFNTASRPDAAEIEQRIKLCYRPYNKALLELLDKAHKENNVCMHFNFHSTPRQPRPNMAVTDIVLGDLDGHACPPRLTGEISDFFRNAGLSVSMNAPFRGGALIRKTCQPENARYSLQVEIVRELYMDTQTMDYIPATGDALRDTLSRLAGFLPAILKP